MNVPDTFVAEVLRVIYELRDDLREMREAMPLPEMMAATDIAIKRACSTNWLYDASYPWRLPNFGKSDEEGKKRWRRETVREWYAEPDWEEKRRAQWEALPMKERAR